MQLLTPEQASRRIIDAVTADPALRARLLADPHAVCSQILGLEIPEEVQISVHEQSPARLHLVIPANPDQLSDADLELVSGGTVGVCVVWCEWVD